MKSGRGLRSAAVAAAAVPLGTAVATIVGWSVGVRALTTLGTTTIPMAPNTAFCLAALGAGAVLVALVAHRRAARILARSLAIAVGALALVRLLEMTLGFDAGSDGWFMAPSRDAMRDWRTPTSLAPIGQVALPTAALLGLASLALFLSTFPGRARATGAAGIVSAGVAAGGFVFVLGYLHGAPLLYQGQVIPMALNTATAIVGWGAAMSLALGLDAPPLRAFAGSSTNARLLRAFLPFTALTVCAVPLLMHWTGSLAGPRYAALASAALVTAALVVAGLLCARLARGAEANLARLEEQLRQSQKMDAVGRLAGGVAHDFNNLLTVITGFTELVLDQLPRDDPRRAHLEEVKGAGARAASLTRQLLLFSRKQEIRPTELDLNAIVTDMLKMLRRLVGENIAIEAAMDEMPSRILADAGQMQQVVLNLVVNARDAMPQGGRIRIETSNVASSPDVPLREGAYVKLAVTDTGCGMSPDVRAHLFEPFFTTKAKGHGTGMGLATVHAIVRQHGGRIAADSEAGRGTTFRLYFPRVSAAKATPAEEAPRAASVRGAETILVVEDEPNIQTFVKSALEAQGYSVLQAMDGTEALRVCERPGQIDLVLTDSVMPLMSGTELAKRLTLLRPDLKVVLMSGYTSEAVSECAAARAFLQKPFSADLLASTVREVLDGKTVTDARRRAS